MENKSNKSSWSLFVYFVLGLLFALLSIVAKRPMQILYERLGAGVGMDTRWFFWLLLVLSALCMVPLIIAILRNLHGQKKLPKFLEFFFQDQFESQQLQLRENVDAWLFGRIGMSFITGAAILLLCIFLMRTNAVDDDNINGQLYELVLRMRGVEHVRQSFSKVSQLVYVTPSRDGEQHLHDLLDIVTRLKNAGVKAVLITLPQFPPEGKNAFRLLREIENSGIVVWGFTHSSMIEPLFQQIADSLGGTLPSMASFMTEADDLWRGPYLARLWRADVGLELLEKYHRYPRFTYVRQWFGNELRFGDYRIPLSKEKWTYALDRYTGGSLYSDIYVHRGDAWSIGHSVWGGMPIRMQRFTRYDGPEDGTDTLKYSGYKWRIGVKYPWLPLEGNAFEEKVKDKIVLLMGNYGSTTGNYLPDRAYAVWLESVLRGDIMKKPESGYLWLSVACLAIAGFIGYRFRPLVAILLMFVLAVCTLAVGSYLYDSKNIIIDIFYPLLSIGVAMIVFLAIAAMHRRNEEMASSD